MIRYRIRTLLILMAIGPPVLAGAILCPFGPVVYLLGLSPLFAAGFHVWRSVTYNGRI